MKFSLQGIYRYLSQQPSVSTIESALTMAGLEVESIEHTGTELSNIVTVQIQSIEPHPDADRLVITQSTDGRHTHQIVTAAKNIAVGDIVPLALPGATLCGGLTIKESKLRGVQSNGMMCSPSECGIDSDVDGIWILDKTTPLGVDFINYAQLQDSILDVNILPNRGDCQSLIGIAREIATLCDCKFTLPSNDISKNPLPANLSSKKIHCETPDLCPIYVGAYLNLPKELAPTPLWMQQILINSGIRPINIIVDITNFVLIETGQPLHAFDYETLKSDTIAVRTASANDILKTLDDTTVSLHESDLIICDDQTPIALAGVMGGAESSVTDRTTTLFLEAASFDPVSVRRTAQRHSLRTESAIRFEKAVDSHQVAWAAQRALHLYETLAGATVFDSSSEFKNSNHSSFSSHELPYNPEKICKIIGHTIEKSAMDAIFTSLGFEPSEQTIKVPTWRQHDVQHTACLAEEVIRIIGVDAIPNELPSDNMIQPLLDAHHQLSDHCRSTFVHSGFQECVTFPMVNEDLLTLFNLNSADTIRIQNPISQDESILRPAVIPSLVKIAHHNCQNKHSSNRLFEIGKCFHPDYPNKEFLHCAWLTTGQPVISPYHSQDQKQTWTLSQMKGFVQQALPDHNIQFKSESIPEYAHPKKTLAVYSDDELIGYIGYIHPLINQELCTGQDIIFGWINLSLCLTKSHTPPQFQAFSRQPSTSRDIAFVVAKDVPFADIDAHIQSKRHELLSHYELFDHFESDELGADKKSMAIRFWYQHPTKTLKDKVVNSIHETFSSQFFDSLPVTPR